MSKSPITPEFKIELCEKYLSGEGSHGPCCFFMYASLHQSMRRYHKLKTS